jgi:N-acetylmuramate 1-kinase
METHLLSRIKELAAECLNASADHISVSKVTGDASTRAYFRAQTDDNSVIVAVYNEPFDEQVRAVERLTAAENQSPVARLTFASDPCAHIETTILFREAGLPVPRVLGSSGADHMLFIEDVGDTRLQDWLAGRSETELKAAYRRAVEMIIKIQEATEKATGHGSICSALAFDEAKLKYELGFFFANYINKYLGAKLDATAANAINQDFKALCSELAARPRVLTHRDYHARNLMMHNNELFIIDQQDARMGPASYDVASLLRDPYAALDNAIAEEMTELFLELKASSSLPLESLAEFRHELHLMTIQRMLKAIGTYAYQAAVMKNQSYISYIEPAAKSALASIAALGRFDTTRALIEKAVS